MKTYEQALKEGRKLLLEAGITEYQVDGFLLMSEVLGITRTDYFMKQKDTLSDADYERYMEAVQRRKVHEPLQYITGHAYFMGYDFMVNEDVLIPRMDTECLVVEAEKIIMNHPFEILDMCTGSGCILISLALRNPLVNGLGADISKKALKVAQQNAEKLQCSN
ncbi:MAG: peptide chain release factor N(5)-glutamine methyltransferase, partial [Thermoflexaceae bacterium]|nr:peptide chain release factor N(5)-glutamine methyltransferase [Thermoflexaceae bacterium]